MIAINLSPKEYQLLMNACTALCEKTAHALAMFGSAQGEMYKIAKKQHDEASSFYEKVELIGENSA